MSEQHILRGGVLLTDWSAGEVLADGAVAWSDGRILAVGARAQVESDFPDASVHEARGGWIAPGLINAHHHFYSTLASGLDPGLPITDFGQRLDRLWWRLDRAHDETSIRHSVRLGALRCALAGCTTVVDHHASPHCIDGVLDVVAEELEEAGLSAVLCYEASDRNGRREANSGLKESARFRSRVAAHPRFRGLIGMHAAFTLRDESLADAAALTEDGDIHIHLAEDDLDGRVCRARDGRGPLQRLHGHGLLGEKSWIAHGVHLDEDELSMLAEHRCLLLHNPESNANNQVGRFDVSRASRLGLRVALGTDGMSPCLLSSLRSAFLLHRAAGSSGDAGWRECQQLLDGAGPMLSRLFGVSGYGTLRVGAPADLVVVDALGLEAPSQGNLIAHLVFGATPLRVRHTIARGRWLVRNFQAQLQDAECVSRELEPVRKALWSRFRATEAGTPYLGPHL